MKNNYTIPEGFDPYYAIYALKGLADFTFEFHNEGDGVNRTLPPGAHTAILGAAWLNRRIANELNDYLAALGEAGINLPSSDEDFQEYSKNEVREPKGLYLVG